jgi:hypothetical protein
MQIKLQTAALRCAQTWYPGRTRTHEPRICRGDLFKRIFGPTEKFAPT